MSSSVWFIKLNNKNVTKFLFCFCFLLSHYLSIRFGSAGFFCSLDICSNFQLFVNTKTHVVAHHRQISRWWSYSSYPRRLVMIDLNIFSINSFIFLIKLGFSLIHWMRACRRWVFTFHFSLIFHVEIIHPFVKSLITLFSIWQFFSCFSLKLFFVIHVSELRSEMQDNFILCRQLLIVEIKIKNLKTFHVENCTKAVGMELF